MVVCKYFQAGYCQYGLGCKFEHAKPRQYGQPPKANVRQPLQQSLTRPSSPRPSLFKEYRPTSPLSPSNTRFPSGATDSSKYRWTSPTLANQDRRPSAKDEEPEARPQPIQRTRKSSGPVNDIESLVKRVHDDITEWHKSAQWPFSAYGWKHMPNFALFNNDLSPEELRCRAYQMRKANKMAEYEVEFKKFENDVRARWTRVLTLSAKNEDHVKETLRPYICGANSPVSLLARKSSEDSSSSFKPSKSTAAAVQERKETRPDQFSFQKALDSKSQPSRPANDQGKQFSFKLPSEVPAKAQSDDKAGFVYSDMKSLTSDEVSAFQAKEFLSLSQIPTRPPPKEFCIR